MTEPLEPESPPPPTPFPGSGDSQLTALFLAIWEFTAGATSPVAERLVAARWAHFLPGSRPHIVLAEGFSFWASYLARLYICRDRYLATCREFIDFMDAHPLEESTGAESSTDLTRRMIGQFGLEDRIRLDLESFYIATKLLLDRIALTFGFFFNRPLHEKGTAHHVLTEHFKRNFKRWSVLITKGQKALRRLLELMRELKKHVVTFRNAHIEHPSHPTVGIRQWSTRQIASDGTPYISMSVVSDDSVSYTVYSNVSQQTEYPSDIIAMVEEYICEMLDYFTTYRGSSIFAIQPDTTPQ